MKNKAYIGIDPSLTNTGVSYIIEKCGVVAHKDIRIRSNMSMFRRQMDMVYSLMDWLDNLDIKYDPKHTHILMEELFHFPNRNQGNVIERIELIGFLKLALYQWGGVSLNVIPIKSLKLSFCGRGNASKEEIAADVYKRTGISGISDDVGDAIALGLTMYDMDIGGKKVPHVKIF